MMTLSYQTMNKKLKAFLTIGSGFLCFSFGRNKKTDDDPYRISLRLLPSGPDRVREEHVHRQPSALYILQSAEFRKAFT
jgi:hypothetical protein